jgi:hypothetical protein
LKSSHFRRPIPMRLPRPRQHKGHIISNRQNTVPYKRQGENGRTRNAQLEKKEDSEKSSKKSLFSLVATFRSFTVSRVCTKSS